jgi:HEAT repeat protein
MFFKPDIEKIKKDGNIDKLIPLLKRRNAGVREEALQAIFDIAKFDPEVLAPFRFMLKDRKFEVRIRATLLYGRLGDPGALENMHEIIARGSIDDQIEVLRILPHYYTKEDDHVTQILALALKDKKSSVQIESIKTIGEMAIETMAFNLLDFVYNPATRFRFETVISLGKVKNPIGIDALKGALTDSSVEVRKAAEDALKMIGTEEALSSLKDAPFMFMVKNMNESVSKRMTTVINIGKQKKEIGLPLLHKCCYDDYKNIRIEAIKSLAMLRKTTSINILIEMLSDQYFDVRIEAIKALSRFNTPVALKAIANAANDPNTNVRLEAKKAYASLSHRVHVDTDEN